MLLLAAVIQASTFSFSVPSKDTVSIGWNGKKVFEARAPGLTGEHAVVQKACEPLYLGYPHGPKTAEFVPAGRERETHTVELTAPDPGGQDRPRGSKPRRSSRQAFVVASSDSMICSDDPTVPLGSTFGRPRVAGANGIYDRKGDWLLTFRGQDVSIVPKGQTGYEIGFGSHCVVELKPNYYRDHLGYFLWDKSKPLWTKPVAGWCSWMAHLQDVREEDVLTAAQFFSKNLKEYGYDVIQIDDGYQRVLQFGQENTGHEPFSSYWTKPNDKFPHGMQTLAHQIKSFGMTPGIWIGYYLPLGLKRQDGYVTDPDGKPHKGDWVNYAMNGLVPAARDEAYIDTVREFKRQGWDYFKIDTLRHVLYDSYRKVPQYWQGRRQSMEEAYRAIMTATKKAAGDSYVLACWGTIPELAGLADGARIGEDVGPNFDSMRRSAKYIAQFTYLNNVVWHNDPDYMCFRVPIEQARAWATLTFLAGGHVMVSDKVEDYDEAHVDVLRRIGPPIFTRPVNVVSHAPDPEFQTLTAEKDGQQWTVMARFAWRDLPAWQEPTAETLTGLTQRYLAFDVWEEKFLGSVTGAQFHALAKGSCQVIGLRAERGVPQVLGTNRHLSQGAYELENVQWKQNKLSGKFKRGAGREWSIFLHVPRSWTATNIQPLAVQSLHDGDVLKLTFPAGSDPMDWEVSFRPVD